MSVPLFRDFMSEVRAVMSRLVLETLQSQGCFDILVSLLQSVFCTVFRKTLRGHALGVTSPVLNFSGGSTSVLGRPFLSLFRLPTGDQ